jgi:glycosyltransferase involved in cell wall biosynthesis
VALHAGQQAPAAEAPRVLFFSPYGLDAPQSGGARRAVQSRDLLRRQGCVVETLVHARTDGAAGATGADTWLVPLRGGHRRFLDPRLLQTLRARLAAFRPDVLWIEQFYSVPQLAWAARRHGVPVIYNAANVEAERFAGWPLPHRVGIGLYERCLLRMVDGCVCVSARDRDLLAARYGFDPARSLVLPNGYDPAVFHPAPVDATGRRALWAGHGIPDDAQVLVFPGHQGYAPNAEARAWITGTLAPGLARRHPGAQIAILGPGLPDAFPGASNVHAVGFVDDLAAHLRAADLLLCPLEHGGGSRLKIIEALACGLPVLSTPKGAEGLEGVDARAGLHLATRAEFAARLDALLDAPPARRSETHPAVAALGLPALGADLRAFVERVAALRHPHRGAAARHG